MSWSNQTPTHRLSPSERKGKAGAVWLTVEHRAVEQNQRSLTNEKKDSLGSDSGDEWSQPQLHMVGQPGGLGRLLGSLLARPDGSRQVAKVVPDLEGDDHVGVVLLLGDHSDEEADLVGFPKGDHARGAEEERR